MVIEFLTLLADRLVASSLPVAGVLVATAGVVVAVAHLVHWWREAKIGREIGHAKVSWELTREHARLPEAAHATKTRQVDSALAQFRHYESLQLATHASDAATKSKAWDTEANRSLQASLREARDGARADVERLMLESSLIGDQVVDAHAKCVAAAAVAENVYSRIRGEGYRGDVEAVTEGIRDHIKTQRAAPAASLSPDAAKGEEGNE